MSACRAACQLWGEVARELPGATLSLTLPGMVPRTPRGSPRLDRRAVKSQLPPARSDGPSSSVAPDSEFPPGSARTSWTDRSRAGRRGRAGPHEDAPGRGTEARTQRNGGFRAGRPRRGWHGKRRGCTPPLRRLGRRAPRSGLLTRQPAGGVVASARGVSRGSGARRACSVGQRSERGGSPGARQPGGGALAQPPLTGAGSAATAALSAGPCRSRD